MTGLHLNLIFSILSLAGLGMILYGIKLKRARAAEKDENLHLGFSESEEEGAGFLDFDTGHEGLKHKEKQPFHPDSYRPEPIESKKKSQGPENS